MQKFLANTCGFDRATASRIMTVALACSCCGSRSLATLSDQIGRRPMLIFFGTCGVMFTYPIFSTLEQTRDPVTAFALVLAALVIVTGYTSINAVVKAELFPSHIRALGVALPFVIANTLFGGTAEAVAL